MTTMFSVRIDGSPRAMPSGTATLSRHRSERAALAAIDDEWRRFTRSPASIGGGYLPRLVVRIDEDGETVLGRFRRGAAGYRCDIDESAGLAGDEAA